MPDGKVCELGTPRRPPTDRLSPDEGTSGHAPFPASEHGHSDAPRPIPAGYGPEDFPGCESFHLPASEIDHYEGRLEFRDGHTETAWKVCEPTSIQHERSSRWLLEQECGFPEIWVLVPWEASRLAIHVRREDGYREEAESRAFPGWKAEEIHRALTEEPLSEEAWRSLERVALAMGAREGTRSEDDPLMRSVSRRALTRERIEAVTATLRARGIEVSEDFAQDHDLFAEHPIEALMVAALVCTDEADFRRRIREAAG